MVGILIVYMYSSTFIKECNIVTPGYHIYHFSVSDLLCTYNISIYGKIPLISPPLYKSPGYTALSPPLPCCFKLAERTVHYHNVLCWKTSKVRPFQNAFFYSAYKPPPPPPDINPPGYKPPQNSL